MHLFWRRGGHIARICGVGAYLSRAVPRESHCVIFEAHGRPVVRLVLEPIRGMTWWGREKLPIKPPPISKKNGRAKDWLPICIRALPGRVALNRRSLLHLSLLSRPNLWLLRQPARRHPAAPGCLCTRLTLKPDGGGCDRTGCSSIRSFQDRFISNANRVVLLNFFHAPIVSVNRRGRPRHVRGFDGWPRGELAAANAVGHIHHDADDGPHEEPHPGHPGKEIHQAEAGQHSQNGNDRHERHTEWPG